MPVWNVAGQSRRRAHRLRLAAALLLAACAVAAAQDARPPAPAPLPPAPSKVEGPPPFTFEPPRDPENPDDDPPWIYGMHDLNEDCAKALEAAGVRGWFVDARGIGRDPNDKGGGDWSGPAARGIGVLCRLNCDFGTQGTIPHARYYDDFAKRCGNFAAASKGCHIWVIGNETNLAFECPKEDGKFEAITPENYGRCFKLCRKAIRAAPGHEKDQVVLQALAPWNNGQETNQGDWLTQLRRMLAVIGGEVDGFAVHVYSLNGHDPARVRENWFQSAYRDYLKAIPPPLARLPAYVTEMGASGGWKDENNGWIKAAFADLHAWNQRSLPKIRAACVYRWGFDAKDPAAVVGRRRLFDDWKDILKMDLHWTARRPLTAKELKALEERQRAEWEKKTAREAERRAREAGAAGSPAAAGPGPAAAAGAINLDDPVSSTERDGPASGTVLAAEERVKPGAGRLIALSVRLSAKETKTFCVSERDAAAFAAAKKLTAGDIVLMDSRVADKMRWARSVEKVGEDGSVKKGN